MTDFRYAWRQLRNSPAFAAVVILLMGIGIAANASIFTLVDALLLKKLPVRNPEELVRIIERRVTGMVKDVILTVVYTERGTRTRIIPARKATKYEQAEYYRSQTAK